MNHRVIVISDIHLSQPPMPLLMSQPARLADFIAGIAPGRRADEVVHLNIAGDFIDFLPMAPFEAFTEDPQRACQKLRAALGGDNQCVVGALAQALHDGVRLTIMAGNHDLELAHPAVQRAFVDLLGPIPTPPEFVIHGEAWRLGGLLVEHGNRYDGANENDWDGMRALVSSQSRGPTLHAQDQYRFGLAVRPSSGSELVSRVINEVRQRYPFVPLLQPEGVLTALLLKVLEPSLKFDWHHVGPLFWAQQAEQRSAPTGIRNISSGEVMLDAELDRMFQTEYRELVQPQAIRDVSRQGWLQLFAGARADSLAQCMKRGEAPSRDVLQALQLLLRKMDVGSPAFRPDGDAGAQGRAATYMVGSADIQTVVMGHTHAARQVGSDARASYINSGTWADMVTVPPVALRETDEGLDALAAFLSQLCADDPACRSFVPTFAEIALQEGVVVSARLETAD